MSLADALARELTPPGPKCSVAYMMKRLDPSDLATFTTALANADITAAAISRALRNVGEEVSAFSVNRHRKGECSCG